MGRSRHPGLWPSFRLDSRDERFHREHLRNHLQRHSVLAREQGKETDPSSTTREPVGLLPGLDPRSLLRRGLRSRTHHRPSD